MDKRLVTLLAAMAVPIALNGQVAETEVIGLEYIAPAELLNELASQYAFSDNNTLAFEEGYVHLTLNYATNEVLMTGEPSALEQAVEIISFLDVAPRQFVIEARIIEINSDRLSELGMDWQMLLDRTSLSAYTNLRDEVFGAVEGVFEDEERHYHRGIDANASINGLRLSDLLKLLQERGIGKVVNTPRIVTTNNRQGMILDGSRVTYVAGYANEEGLYETKEMTAGLSLAVTPSLGASAYIRLEVSAKLTQLGQVIGGHPSESGQIIENVIMAMEGEEFVLGGFQTTAKTSYRRKVPILGTILPFLFSRTRDVETTRNFIVVLKPMVVDLDPEPPPSME